MGTFKVCICVSFLLLHSSCGSAAKVELRRAGISLSRELEPLIEKSKIPGSIVVLIGDDPMNAGFLGRELSSGIGEAAKAKGWQFESLAVPVSPSVELDGQPITREVFLQVLKDKQDAGLIISTLGAPRLTEQDLQSLGNVPPVIIVTEFQLRYAGELPRSVFKFCAVSKRSNEARVSEGSELQKRFTILFQSE